MLRLLESICLTAATVVFFSVTGCGGKDEPAPSAGKKTVDKPAATASATPGTGAAATPKTAAPTAAAAPVALPPGAKVVTPEAKQIQMAAGALSYRAAPFVQFAELEPPAVEEAELARQDSFSNDGGGATQLRFSADGNELWGLLPDGALRVWDAKGPTRRTSPEKFAGKTVRFALSPDGKHVCVSTGEPTARVLAADTFAVYRTIKDDKPITAVAFAADPKLLLVGNAGGAVSVWNLETDAKLAGGGVPADSKQPAVTAIVMTPDGERIVTGHADGIALWTAWPQPKHVEFRRLAINEVSELTMSPAGDKCLAHSADGVCILATLGEADKYRPVPVGQPDGLLKTVAFSPGGKYTIVYPGGQNVRLFNAAERASAGVAKYLKSVQKVMGVAVSPDGRRAVASYDKGQIRAWRLPKPNRTQPELIKQMAERLDELLGREGFEEIEFLATEGRTDRTTALLASPEVILVYAALEELAAKGGKGKSAEDVRSLLEKWRKNDPKSVVAALLVTKRKTAETLATNFKGKETTQENIAALKKELTEQFDALYATWKQVTNDPLLCALILDMGQWASLDRPTALEIFKSGHILGASYPLLNKALAPYLATQDGKVHEPMLKAFADALEWLGPERSDSMYAYAALSFCEMATMDRLKDAGFDMERVDRGIKWLLNVNPDQVAYHNFAAIVSCLLKDGNEARRRLAQLDESEVDLDQWGDKRNFEKMVETYATGGTKPKFDFAE